MTRQMQQVYIKQALDLNVWFSLNINNTLLSHSLSLSAYSHLSLSQLPSQIEHGIKWLEKNHLFEKNLSFGWKYFTL